MRYGDHHLLILAYSLLSFVTFIAYGCDKFAARNGKERVSERSLHLLSLCGGWPGALAAQRLFRHKTRKTSFQTGFRFSILVNVLLLAWYLYS